jgi:hypothetical protein
MDRAARTRSTAFGLDIDSDQPLSFLAGARARPTGRALTLTVQSNAGAEPDWPDGAELICNERVPGGGVNFQILTHPDAGYLIAGPAYGAHLLSPDGRRLRCFTEALPDGSWQRMLVAQVLPFAALLHGLEVFHASAVVQDGSAVAFVGPSRSGKTSLAMELCRRGACFVADDALALERVADTLLANPGSPVAGVARAIDPAEGNPTNDNVVAISARERMVRVEGATGPTPLARLFFIDRREDGPEQPQFRPANDALMLLAATFNFVLATPERLEGLLEVCAIAARLPVELITSSLSTNAIELADAVEQRLRRSP